MGGANFTDVRKALSFIQILWQLLEDRGRYCIAVFITKHYV